MIRAYIAYLKDNPEHRWFKPKLFGWGWTPARWQGWLSIVVYVVVAVWLLDSGMSLDTTEAVNVFLAAPMRVGLFVLLTGAFIVLCFKTGGPARWNWGIPQKYREAEQAEKDKAS
jgi:hypothetical protein